LVDSRLIEVTILAGVNILAIGLTDDHPAYDDGYPWIENALDGANVLLVFDSSPLRTQYILIEKFEGEAGDAPNIIYLIT